MGGSGSGQPVMGQLATLVYGPWPTSELSRPGPALEGGRSVTVCLSVCLSLSLSLYIYIYNIYIILYAEPR